MSCDRVNLLIVGLEGCVADSHVVVSLPVGPDPIEGRSLLGELRREPALQHHVLPLRHVDLQWSLALPGHQKAWKEKGAEFKNNFLIKS